MVSSQFTYPKLAVVWLTALRSLIRLPNDVNVMVDLDAEQGRSGSKTPNIFRLVVRPTKKVNLVVIEEYLRGNGSISKEVLEGLST